MANDALRNRFSTHFAERFYSEFKNNSDDQYFLFAGKVSAWSNENSPDASTDSVYHSNYAWRNAVALKRIDITNIFHAVPRYNWASGTIFSEYDDSTDIVGNNFYVLTEDNNVYKCIYNNDGGASTTKPSGTGTEIFTTDDGYRWKFMFRISDDALPFLTKEYIPVELISSEPEDGNEKRFQWDVQVSSTPGAIEDIRVGSTGDSEYHSSTLTSLTIGEPVGSNAGANDAGSNQVILNNAASETDDYYNNYVLYIDGGQQGEIGQLKRITDYVGAERKAILHENLDVGLEHGVSTYVIRPEVVISGDGIGAKVLAQMNSNKTIKDLTTLDSGKSYTYATARITTTVSAGSSDPSLSLEISPEGGHGFNPIKELEASKVLIAIKTDGDEDGIFNVANDFRQFGIIKNPIVATGPARGQVAGREHTKYTELTVRKPYNIMPSDYNYHEVTGTFVKGNYILGSSTLSTSKIESWKASTRDEKEGILEVSTINGGFSGPSSTKKLIRVDVDLVYGTGNFTLGETVRQSSGGTAATAIGSVESWDGDLNELIIEVKENTFSGTTAGITGDDSGAGYGPPFFDFSNAGGELIKQFKSIRSGASAGYFELLNASGNTQDHGRIMQVSDVIKNQNLNPVYRQTHKLTVSGSALTSTTFTKDSEFIQKDGGATTGTLKLTTGDVVSWDYTSGTTGALYLTNLVGSVTGGGYSGGDANSIDKIEIPELVVGSGEVLYIQNIRPVQRNLEQKEEFKILIGF